MNSDFSYQMNVEHSLWPEMSANQQRFRVTIFLISISLELKQILRKDVIKI